MFNDMKKSIEDFVNINNEYVNIKVQEEKVKVSASFSNLIILFNSNRQKNRKIHKAKDKRVPLLQRRMG